MRNTNVAVRAAPEVMDAKHAALHVERQPDGTMRARSGGVDRVVHVRRCFPWSEPGRFISLRDDDENEVALVADVAALEEPARGILLDSLAEAGFVFDVAAVLDIDEEVELRQWHVRTDQGERRFQTRLDEWPRRLPGGGLLIRDVTGDFYRVRDAARLDRRSRSLLWAFVD